MSKLVLLAVAGAAVAAYVYRDEIKSKLKEYVEGVPEEDILQALSPELAKFLRDHKPRPATEGDVFADREQL